MVDADPTHYLFGGFGNGLSGSISWTPQTGNVGHVYTFYYVVTGTTGTTTDRNVITISSSSGISYEDAQDVGLYVQVNSQFLGT